MKAYHPFNLFSLLWKYIHIIAGAIALIIIIMSIWSKAHACHWGGPGLSPPLDIHIPISGDFEREFYAQVEPPIPPEPPEEGSDD